MFHLLDSAEDNWWEIEARLNTSLASDHCRIQHLLGLTAKKNCRSQKLCRNEWTIWRRKQKNYYNCCLSTWLLQIAMQVVGPLINKFKLNMLKLKLVNVSPIISINRSNLLKDTERIGPIYGANILVWHDPFYFRECCSTDTDYRGYFTVWEHPELCQVCSAMSASSKVFRVQKHSSLSHRKWDSTRSLGVLGYDIK